MDWRAVSGDSGGFAQGDVEHGRDGGDAANGILGIGPTVGNGADEAIV